MPTPSDLYTRFLITKGFNKSEELSSEMAIFNLRPPDNASFERQIDLVYKTVPQQVVKQIETKKPGKDFLKWMEVLEVKPLWLCEQSFLDAAMKRKLTIVLGILDDQVLKMTVNTLLIKNVTPKDLVDLINLKFSAMMKEEYISFYRDFFFDPRRMTRKDWKIFLKGEKGKSLHLYFTALSDSIEVLKTELELPTTVNVTEPLQYLLMKSYQKAKLYLEHSTKEANSEARAWISQVNNLVDRYERYKTGDKADFAKQLQMQFDFIDEPFLTPEQLGIVTQSKEE
jgi:hypothetical protein